MRALLAFLVLSVLVCGCASPRRQDARYEIWWTWDGGRWVSEDGRTLEDLYLGQAAEKAGGVP